MLVVEVDGLVARGRALHRQVQAKLRVRLRGVGEQPRVGHDDRVHPEPRGAVTAACHLRQLPAAGRC